MDIDEYDLMIESGRRPGVRVVGLIVLGSLMPICGILAILTLNLLR